MLRLNIHGARIILESLEKQADLVKNVRQVCTLPAIKRVPSRRADSSSSRTKSSVNFTGTEEKQSRSFSSGAGSTEPQKTCLYDLHVDKQGKLVNFAGWMLPVQYKEAIAASHQHTRTFASLFDVGHMLQSRVSGKDAGEFLESLTTSDLKNLADGSATLTVFTNDRGGILDDLIITRDRDDKYFVVSNAGRRDEDSKLLLDQQVSRIFFR